MMIKLDTRNWQALSERYEALLESPLTAKEVPTWLREWSDLEAQIKEDASQAASRSHENTADQVAEERYLHYVREILPKMEVAHDQLVQRLFKVEDYTPPADQQLMMQDFHVTRRLFRAENVPLQTEISVLRNQFRKVTGGMTIEWAGETRTFNQAALLYTKAERDQRELAWRTVHERWLEDRTTLNQLYLDMLALRRQIGRNAEFENYRAYAWLDRGRYDYQPEDAFVFHDAIEQEVVPVAQRIYERRRAALGLERLRPWDLDVETSNQPPLQPFQDVAELEEGCSRIFHAIDPLLGEQFDVLRDGYLDLASRPNKAQGGYCSARHVSKRSYIFMNAVGQHRNVQTLLHEGGHAFHNQHATHLPLIWMRHAPMEMCEVASMGMELLASPYFEKEKGGFYSQADANRARIEHLEELVLFFPYMAVVDAFQHWVYSDAPEDLSAEALDQKWGELWDRFMVGVEWSGLETQKRTGWHRKRHIFLYPFYYIEYGLAQVGALQVWRNALNDQADALAAYRHALSLGGTRSLSQLYHSADIRFAFDAPTLRQLMALVEEKLDELRAN
ncbi:MAG: M3 family oligoendopeptidase [Ardenticatenaceae bacterium]